MAQKEAFFAYNTTVDEHEDDRFAERKDGIGEDRLRACRNTCRRFRFNFPCVCPEPVLANLRVL